MDDRGDREIKTAIEHGLAQAERGEGMTVVEAKARTMAAIMRVATEQAERNGTVSRPNRPNQPKLQELCALITDEQREGNAEISATPMGAEISEPDDLADVIAFGEHIAERDAEALRFLGD